MPPTVVPESLIPENIMPQSLNIDSSSFQINTTQMGETVLFKLQNPNADQRFAFMLIGIYAISILVVWNVPVIKHILYPYKLITVAFHELGHAIAGKCTGARIESISVDPNEGGVTKMRGGNQCCVLPAGYIGSSVIGALLIFCGFNIVSSKVASVFVCCCLLATLYWAENWFTRILTLIFFVQFPLFWIFYPVALTYVILFLGVMSAMYSMWDIVEDLITRKVNSSDAAVFAKRYGGKSQMWGVFWFIISLVFIALSIVLALIAWVQSFSESYEVDGIQRFMKMGRVTRAMDMCAIQQEDT